MSRRSTTTFVAAALVVAMVLGVLVSPFASGSPDGLEKVAEDKAFLDRGGTHPIQEGAPIPDYAFPGVASESVATALAGLVGTLVVFALGYGLAALARGRRSRASGPPGDTAEPAA